MFLYLEKKENGQENLIQCFNSITCSKNTTPDLDYATTQGFKHCLWRLLPPSFDKTKTKCVKGSIPNTEHLLPNNPLLLLWDKWDWWLSKSLHLRHCIILLRKHWSLRSIPLSIIYCLCWRQFLATEDTYNILALTRLPQFDSNTCWLRPHCSNYSTFRVIHPHTD